MKFIKYIGLFFLVASCSTSQFGRNFEIRDYKTVKLSNGLNVLLIQDDSLPYFSAAMLFNMGSAGDPVSHPGLTAFVGGLLNKGTQEKSATELAAAFGAIGTELSVSVDSDYTFLSAGTLSHHQDKLLGLLGEVLAKQSFSNSEIRRRRKQTLSAIKKSSNDPSSFSSQMFGLYLYGAHPYGRSTLGTAASVNGIKKRDIIRHYMRYFRPNNATLAIVGNIEANIESKLENAFKDWKPRKSETNLLPKVPKIVGRSIRLVNKSDLVQAQIRMGHIGIKRTDPDFLKLRVANTILGRGFVSRLMDKIRDNMGLTYHIGSQFDARSDNGPFLINTFTQTKTVGKTVAETLKVVDTFHSKGVTDEEVESAKNYLLGVFPQAIDTPEKLAFNLLILRYYGIPDSYLTNYQKTISRITTDEVNAAIKKHLDPENLKILVYANGKKVIDQLRPIELVETRNYKEF